jgi:predicted Zn-dependent protease
VQLTSRKSANFIDTLAGAYAEAGRFDQAIAASTEAIDLAAKGGDEASVRVFRQRLQNYERDEPTRESLGCPRTSD